MLAILDRLFSRSARPAPATGRLKPEQAAAIAACAAAGTGTATTGTAVPTRTDTGLVWDVCEVAYGSGWRVFVDDATGARPARALGPQVSPRARGRVLGALALLGLAAGLAPQAVQARAGGAYPLACRDVHADFARTEHCARRAGDFVRIDPVRLARMPFRGGVTEIVVDGVGSLWARRDGLALPVFPLDNGPDPFAQGLVRARHAGKVAFHDRRLRRVLATNFDWSFPFNARGEALVCQGCRSDGREPSAMVGGRWGLIDRRGRLTRPLAEGRGAARRYFDWPR
ncbi:hypothetical protein [Methylobacterium sp.]|uniref:hypothetical protein n=1 Tax=Methylobacterium sp. TaxID=409 RepID=UPI003AFF84E6